MAAWASRHGWPVVASHDGVSTVTLSDRVCAFSVRQANLATAPLPALDLPPDLVSASALLDLVSISWVQALVEACQRVSAAGLFVLSYDGRLECTPGDPLDGQVQAWVNGHQRTDKGFGPALGPDATNVAAEAFERAGYEVRRRQSDWVLGAPSSTLIVELVNGWASAATECAGEARDAIEAWRVRRVDEALRGELRVMVGHEDLAARPAR
jgi:hypothetical protein